MCSRGGVQNCPDARSVFDRRLSAAEATPTLQTQAHGCWDMREYIPKESGRSHHFSQRYLEISPEDCNIRTVLLLTVASPFLRSSVLGVSSILSASDVVSPFPRSSVLGVSVSS